MLAALAVCWRRHVEGGAAVEEADRFEGEADVVYRHDRPVLYAGDMVLADGVPEDHVGVLNRAVGLCPGGESCSTGVLVGIVTARVTLLGTVGRDPEVLRCKACTLEEA